MPVITRANTASSSGRENVRQRSYSGLPCQFKHILIVSIALTFSEVLCQLLLRFVNHGFPGVLKGLLIVVLLGHDDFTFLYSTNTLFKYF